MDDGQESSQPSTRERLQSQGESDVKFDSGHQTDKLCLDESNTDGDDAPKSRPMSPLTLALRCDEQDTMFITAGSPSGLASQAQTTSSQIAEQSITEVYAEQERIVLTKFRDCLNRLITFGELRGKILAIQIPRGLSLVGQTLRCTFIMILGYLSLVPFLRHNSQYIKGEAVK